MTNLRALIDALMKLPLPLRRAVHVVLCSGPIHFAGECLVIRADSTTASALSVNRRSYERGYLYVAGRDGTYG